jgi:molybdopterin synthase catalytic subunit
MRVRVLFFGVLKDVVGCPEELLEVAPGATLEDVFSAYAKRFETLRASRSSILFARNQEFAKPGTVLSENDEVAFLPPVSGGSGGPIVALTRDAIDTRKLVETLQRPEDGAVVAFDGVVRNNTKGRPTRYLEYECYEEMAKAQMARISLEIAQQFAIGRIGMIHRLGRLEIGEASVVVAVTAPHRKPAFEAALEGINRLKREVPIWKKEFFVDGEVWVDGEWDERLLLDSPQREPR